MEEAEIKKIIQDYLDTHAKLDFDEKIIQSVDSKVSKSFSELLSNDLESHRNYTKWLYTVAMGLFLLILAGGVSIGAWLFGKTADEAFTKMRIDDLAKSSIQSEIQKSIDLISKETVKNKQKDIENNVKELVDEFVGKEAETKVSKALENKFEELKKGSLQEVLNKVAFPQGAIVGFDLNVCPNGWSKYDKAQGKFLRGIDENGKYDLRNRNPGHYQEDTFQGHIHGIDQVSSSSHQPGVGSPHGYLNGPYSYGVVKTKDPINDGSNGKPRISNETRPKNVAVLFCMKDKS